MQWNDEQQAAIDAQGHTLLLAGAGTGKTRTLIGRMSRLLQAGQPPDSIAAVTFTRNAAKEIRDRLTTEHGEDADDVFVGTFHGFCYTHLMRHRDLTDLDQLRILSRDQARSLWRQTRGSVIDDAIRAREGQSLLVPREVAALPEGMDVPEARDIQSWYGFYRSRGTTDSFTEHLAQHNGLAPDMGNVVALVAERYMDTKDDMGVVDFDDIQSLMLNELVTNDNFRSAITAQYATLLVDEMQDTNPVQWAIVEAISDDVTVFAVGDDAQSIYAFRGADVENVRSFTKRLPDARVLSLTMNYRSTQQVLDLANEVLDQSPVPYDKRLISATGATGPVPTRCTLPCGQTEADAVMAWIHEGGRNGTPLEDNMVLVRNAVHALQLQVALQREGVPFRFIGGQNLFEAAHVVDVMSALWASTTTSDATAWHRFLCLYPGVGDATASQLHRHITGLHANDGAAALASSTQVKGYDARMHTCIHAIQAAETVQEKVRAAVDALSPLLSGKKAYESTWSRREMDLLVMVDVARAADDLSTFLNEYTMDGATTPDAAGDQGVLTVSTIHSAKGTEAARVAVMGVQSGNLPSLSSRTDPHEERRIFYVALTRAREDLLITGNAADARADEDTTFLGECRRVRLAQ